MVNNLMKASSSTKKTMMKKVTKICKGKTYKYKFQIKIKVNQTPTMTLILMLPKTSRSLTTPTKKRPKTQLNKEKKNFKLQNDLRIVHKTYHKVRRMNSL